MASYTVTDVREGNRDNYGNQAYYIDTVEGPEGVYFKCKPKNAPQVGQSYEWELEDGEYGPRFRRPQQEGGNNSGASQKPAQRPSGGGGPTTTDKQIVRQHSQKVASEHVNVYTAIDSPEEWAKFTAICDKLCADVFEFANGQPATSTQSVDLAQKRKELQAALKEASIELPDGVAAIAALYGRTQLEAGDDLNAIVAKAKELADEEVPF